MRKVTVSFNFIGFLTQNQYLGQNYKLDQCINSFTDSAAKQRSLSSKNFFLGKCCFMFLTFLFYCIIHSKYVDISYCMYSKYLPTSLTPYHTCPKIRTTIAPDERVYKDFFFYFSKETYVVGTH